MAFLMKKWKKSPGLSKRLINAHIKWDFYFCQMNVSVKRYTLAVSPSEKIVVLNLQYLA